MLLPQEFFDAVLGRPTPPYEFEHKPPLGHVPDERYTREVPVACQSCPGKVFAAQGCGSTANFLPVRHECEKDGIVYGWITGGPGVFTW